MSEWPIYWVLKLDSIITYTGGVAAFAGLLTVVAGAVLGANICDVNNERQGAKKWLKFSIPFALCTLFCVISFSLTAYMLPTTKEYLIIKGISYATNNERIATTADKIFDGVEEYIDQRLGELTTNKGGHNADHD